MGEPVVGVAHDLDVGDLPDDGAHLVDDRPAPRVLRRAVGQDRLERDGPGQDREEAVLPGAVARVRASLGVCGL